MARHPFQQLPRERQDQILDLAGLEFARSGFQGTSYNQLLERLHLGKSSAYYYFDDKRDLFLTVIQRCYATYFASLARLEKPRSADEFWAFVHGASVQGFAFMLQDPTAAQLMQCAHHERSLLGELLSFELLEQMNAFYEEMIVLGQGLAAVREDMPQRLLVETVRNLSVTFDQWFIAEFQRGNDPSAEVTASLFTDLLRRGVDTRR